MVAITINRRLADYADFSPISKLLPSISLFRSSVQSVSSAVELTFRTPESVSCPQSPTHLQSWICCQLGAREHYAVPRALLAAGSHCSLITDAWIQPGNLLGYLKKSLADRYHADLARSPINACNTQVLAFELRSKLAGLRGWRLVIARNQWFQRKVISTLSASQLSTLNSQPTLFSYSYAALELFRLAKQQGWRTVLGQIDPGPPEERIVKSLYKSSRERGAGRWEPAPPEYWADWREECQLADRIVVNSKWSQRALVDEGVPAEKLRVIPLAYGEREDGRRKMEDRSREREYPVQFSGERPLRVLFLGQINLRKGVGPLMEAARLLRDQPIEFWMVGPIQIEVPSELRNNPRFRWTGSVPRSAAANYYRDADVFLFPTFSDGFGLTQLEAQAWKLPVIASKFCGEVVNDGVNGCTLEEVSAKAIADALRLCLAEPARLREFSRNAVPPDRFGLKRIGEQLVSVFEEA